MSVEKIRLGRATVLVSGGSFASGQKWPCAGSGVVEICVKSDRIDKLTSNKHDLIGVE